jgi:SAM-dependent methyltransferase
MIETTTASGLHAFVVDRVLRTYARPGARAVDLGSGPGAMVERLQSLGCNVIAVDRTTQGYRADAPLFTVDLNERDFSDVLGLRSFHLVTAIEVIEHLESPICFLRNVGRLLAPGGVAVLTTPNVDSLPARVKFLLTGKIRTMDEGSEPTHISPVFWDLFRRQFLALANVGLRDRLVFPPNGYQLTRKSLAWIFRLARPVFRGECLAGDNHIWVIEALP